MDKRKLGIIVMSLVGVVWLALIIYFFFFFKFPGSVIPVPVKAPVAETTTNNQPSLPAVMTPIVKQAEIPATTTVPPATNAEVTQSYLTKVASSFAERLGSYSNQDNYANIMDLKIQMTASMQKWADSYIAAAKKANPYSGVYQGLTTHAITSEIKNFDNAKGTADILVQTQKVVSNEAATSTAAYTEDLLVSFVKENVQWLVNNIKWQNKSTKN